MPWWRIDDGLHDHAKVRALLPVTHPLALWLVAGSWCAASSHDGYVPRDVARRWCRSYTALDRLADALVDAELWELRAETGALGWWFHDWTTRNPSAEEVKARREADAERQRRSRANRAASQRDEDVTNAVTHAWPVTVPHPVPSRPIPPSSSISSSPKESDRQAEEEEALRTEARRRLRLRDSTSREPVVDRDAWLARTVADLRDSGWRPPPPRVPDASEWLAEHRAITPSPPPPDLRKRGDL